MHAQVRQWFEYVKTILPACFDSKTVIDIGSLDINGNLRGYFTRCNYIGLDCGPGPNVDVVCVAHEFDVPDSSFDVVVSSDALEHDMHWMRTIKKMYTLLKPGGLMIFTCGGPGRGEHGTVSHSPRESPHTTKMQVWADHYRNLDESDVAAVLPLKDMYWEMSRMYRPGWGCDLRFWGIR